MSSESTFDVTAQFDVMVEMRDGTRLATDVFRPVDPETGEPVERPLPALLERCPYGKAGDMDRNGRWFAERGYVVAIQDVRGRFNSEGTFDMFVHEPTDGYDTVEWLAAQPYCDGKVGTIGTSYCAWVQSALATQNPPHLEAMFIQQGAANARKASFRHNGAFELRILCWAFNGVVGAQGVTSEVEQTLADTDLRDILAHGPIHRGQTPLRHVANHEDWLFEFMEHGSASDEIWQEPGLNFERYYDQMADVPTVYSGCWYGSYAKGVSDNFIALADRKESEQFLIMGPWTYGWDRGVWPSWNKSYSGEVEFGSAALMDYQRTRLRFFDHYLKGLETWNEPPVRYFVMGTGDGREVTDGRLSHGGYWDHSTDWPTCDTNWTTYYAHGDGTLTTETPQESESRTTYEFDPRNPVPTIGGNCSSYHTFEPRTEPILEYPLQFRKALNITGSGGYDQRTRPETFGAEPPYGSLEERQDVVVFRTPPLDTPVTVVGPIRVRVYGSTDAPDTDFTAKLIDEYPPSGDFPNGFALQLSSSICRARYRGYRDEPDFVEPGKIYEFYMEPFPTANVFKEDHSIRLDISSSNFPRFDVNHNTGGLLYGDRTYRTATNTIHHEANHPTHVELPVQRD